MGLGLRADPGHLPPMGRFLTSLLALIGVQPTNPPADVPTLDPQTILFSVSTINDALPPLEPAQAAGDDLAINEDDWRQIEFYPADRVAELQGELRTLARFAAAHRQQHGFREIYVRRLAARPVLSGGDAAAGLARDLSVPVGRAPILYSGADTIIGRVAGGFSLRLNSNVRLYGHGDRSGILVLGAEVGEDGDHGILAQAFVDLHHRHRLVPVDWRSHMLLAGVAADGSIEVWRPD